ncbi:hypothetical protein Acr_00g0056670 [Actinidia rufa]|uniref:DDE Tnp4 domain-containing protein n=1 Tax=Actinidia rufa TaxID=165716 RepID=A0A7J0DMI3_9ERIC|nr:hypothetical protein Acr_00g0056670 [Actinidia rufa]
MQFIYVLPGWEWSASDSRVLRNAIHRPHGLEVPTGFYYLVDGGYTNGEGFLAPYRGQRYHLSTWRDGPQPENAEEFFNMKHFSARNVIERCIGLLKIRWGNIANRFLLSIQDPNVKWQWIQRMDSIGTSASKQKKGKGKVDGRTRRSGFFQEVEKKVIMVFPGTDLRASPHIDSKIKMKEPLVRGAEGPAEAIDREEALGEGDDTNFTINIDDMDFSGNSGSEGGAMCCPTSKGRKKRTRAFDLASIAYSFATLIEKAHTSMNELSKRIRLRVADEIVKNDKRVNLFFSFPDDIRRSLFVWC